MWKQSWEIPVLLVFENLENCQERWRRQGWAGPWVCREGGHWPMGWWEAPACFPKRPSWCVSEEGSVLREGTREQIKQAGERESPGVSLGEATLLPRKRTTPLVLGKDRCNASCSGMAHATDVSGRSGDGPGGTPLRIGWPERDVPLCRAKEIWDNVLVLTKPRVSAYRSPASTPDPGVLSPPLSWANSLCLPLSLYLYIFSCTFFCWNALHPTPCRHLPSSDLMESVWRAGDVKQNPLTLTLPSQSSRGVRELQVHWWGDYHKVWYEPHLLQEVSLDPLRLYSCPSFLCNPQQATEHTVF